MWLIVMITFSGKTTFYVSFSPSFISVETDSGCGREKAI